NRANRAPGRLAWTLASAQAMPDRLRPGTARRLRLAMAVAGTSGRQPAARHCLVALCAAVSDRDCSAQGGITPSGLALRVLKIPLMVMLASMLGGVLLSWMTGERLPVALTLSTGFGWFSLSGALAGQHLGDAYGSVALLTDLMRELIGLTVVFLL